MSQPDPVSIPFPSGHVVERLIRFRLGNRAYAIRMNRISGLIDADGIQPVDGMPGGVLGLATWRGRTLTVMNLPALLGRPQTVNGACGCLVRLSEPHGAIALWVPVHVHVVRHRERIEEPPPRSREDEAHVGVARIEDETHHIIDPRAYLASIPVDDGAIAED